jgi:4-hydroxy-2-oxoheptanedioate aldolase
MTRKIILLLFCMVVAVFTLTVSGQGGDPNYKPKRLNKMIELLEAGQPVYDISVQGVGYEEGKKLSQDRYDLIQYQMEHGPFDPIRLREFMRGLVDGGPTKSGHRTPTVIVTLPVLGLDEQTVKNNHWVIEQILSAGVHGLMMCHARTPEAVKMFVATARYQFERPNLKGADKGIPEGLRGSGSQGYAAQIWGISGNEYVVRADPWPMNPQGELILSLKMEDKYALANVDQITRVPGIAWGEWGPGDQAMSLVGLPAFLGRRGGGGGDAGGGRGRGGRGRGAAASNEPVPEGLPVIADARLQAARERIMNAMKAAKWAPLHSATVNNIEQLIRAGIMVTHGSSLELTNKGRAYTKRQMPY